MFDEILSAEQMRRADRYSAEVCAIAGTELMERAGRAVYKAAVERFPYIAGRRVEVFCGGGNNGGDGFVIARCLKRAGADARVILCADRERLRGDALYMFEKMGDVPVVTLEEYDVAGPAYFAVDALLGTGARGELRPAIKRALECIARLRAPVVAVDLPSGFDADTGAPLGDIGELVKCAVTVTFCREKYAHRLYPCREYCGEIILSDIGIPDKAAAQACPQGRLVSDKDAEFSALFASLTPKDNSHKGSMGKVMIVGGAHGMTGAPVMAGRAAMRSGAGLCTVAVPRSIYTVAACKLTEAMALPVDDNGVGAMSRSAIPAVLQQAQKCGAVAVGCGLSVCADTGEIVSALLENVKKPLIIDADGINIVSRSIEWIKGKGNVILTPHSAEMGRLCGLSPAEVEADRIGTATRFARENGVTVVLKGPGTITALPDGRFFVNTTGNAGMATGGSGDVLCGVITALAAYGLENWQSAAAGVYFHGLAGDIAAQRRGLRGLTAGDIIDSLPEAFKKYEER